MIKILIIICCLFCPSILLGAEEPSSGIGDVAANLLQPVNILADFIGSASIIIGVTLLFGAILKYLQYRINPLASPISTVILLLILGLMLILLPFAYMLTQSGVAYSFFY